MKPYDWEDEWGVGAWDAWPVGPIDRAKAMGMVDAYLLRNALDEVQLLAEGGEWEELWRYREQIVDELDNEAAVAAVHAEIMVLAEEAL